MFGHKINGLLPRKEDLFEDEKKEKYDQIRQKLVARQEKQKEYYDRNAKPLKNVEEGEIVFLDDKYTTYKGQPKELAKVLSEAERPRSNKLLKEDGHIVERNRRHLLCGNKDIEFRVKKEIPDISPPDDVSDPPSKNIFISRSPEKQSNFNNSKAYTRFGRLVKKPSYLKDYV